MWHEARRPSDRRTTISPSPSQLIRFVPLSRWPERLSSTRDPHSRSSADATLPPTSLTTNVLSTLSHPSTSGKTSSSNSSASIRLLSKEHLGLACFAIDDDDPILAGPGETPLSLKQKTRFCRLVRAAYVLRVLGHTMLGHFEKRVLCDLGRLLFPVSRCARW